MSHKLLTLQFTTIGAFCFMVEQNLLVAAKNTNDILIEPIKFSKMIKKLKHYEKFNEWQKNYKERTSNTSKM